MGFVWAVLIMIFGLVMLLRPKEFIELRNRWRYRSAEPTERYILSIRICGGVFIALGILFFVIDMILYLH